MKSFFINAKCQAGWRTPFYIWFFLFLITAVGAIKTPVSRAIQSKVCIWKIRTGIDASTTIIAVVTCFAISNSWCVSDSHLHKKVVHKKISCQHPGWCKPFRRFCTCCASEAGASQHQPQSSRQLACPAVMWHTWQLEEKLLSTASTPRTQQAFDGIARGVHEQESPSTASPVR